MDFNGRFRDEYLYEHSFNDIAFIRKITNDWQKDDDVCRPHSSLDCKISSGFTEGWRKI
ncbi:integrase core domain-containing protein [Pantoea sp. KPR_PJ]|uniref:integrase core domain-containing protein n=1 Tax=Pantoea sp. KPR_PJ TaxID=2738375 RepID=UPI0035285219